MGGLFLPDQLLEMGVLDILVPGEHVYIAVEQHLEVIPAVSQKGQQLGRVDVVVQFVVYHDLLPLLSQELMVAGQGVAVLLE